MTTCTEARERIDRYAADALDPADRAAMERHLAGCAECAADLEAARFLARPVADLRREIAPPADLWTGIAPRLSRARRLSLPIWWLAAAAILLMVATSAITAVLLRGTRGAVSEERSIGFASTEARYREAALEVADLYQRARDSLTPETRLVLERNLSVIERALTEARAALETDPTNRTLEAMVVAAYQRKIEFLERAAALDRKG